MIPNSDHDAALSGDILRSPRLNYEWRLLVVEGVSRHMDFIASTIEDDTERDTFESRAAALVEDFYTPEDSVLSAFEIGDIKIISHDTIPTGWFLCDGSAISRATYSDLFALIGTDYGNGDGSTTFNLPDFRGRTAIGAGTGTGLSARSIAQQIGGETHQLTISEMPSHNHTINIKDNDGSPRNTNAGAGNGGSPDRVLNAPINNRGGDTPHNNMQPSLVMNYIIKV